MGTYASAAVCLTIPHWARLPIANTERAMLTNAGEMVAKVLEGEGTDEPWLNWEHDLTRDKDTEPKVDEVVVSCYGKILPVDEALKQVSLKYPMVLIQAECKEFDMDSEWKVYGYNSIVHEVDRPYVDFPPFQLQDHVLTREEEHQRAQDDMKQAMDEVRHP